MLSLVERLQEGISAQSQLDSEKRLSRDKRQKLMHAATMGIRARNSIVEANTGLVFKWARINKGQGVDMEDLIQEGNLGLMRAAEMFNPNGGAQFSTYATRRIRADIAKGIHNMSRTIRIPHDKSSLLKTMKKIEAEYAEGCGTTMPLESLAEAMNISQEDAAHLRTIEKEVLSIHYGQDDGKGGVIEFANTIADSNTPPAEEVLVATAERKSKADVLQLILDESGLSEEEKDMLWLYFAEAQEPETVAELRSKQRSWATRVANVALRKIQAEMESEEKRSYYKKLLEERN